MPDKDINIHVRAKQTEEAKRKIDGVASSTKKIGNEAGQSGSKLGKMTTSILKWTASLVGIAAVIRGITAAIRINKEAMIEHGDVAEQQQKRLLRLQHLGGFFKENPELRKEVAAYAELGGRPFEEVADAWYNLRSKSGALGSSQQRRILTEALELGRTDPFMPLDVLVDMFSLYAKKTGQVDANRIQNVLQQTITEAGGGGADVAAYMPRFLPIGMAGGLSGPEAAGLWSYATTQTADPATATTGLKALFLGLQGKGTPESQKILSGLGIGKDTGFFEKMQRVSGAFSSGRFTLGQAEQLAGREGADVLLSLLSNPQAMAQAVGRVASADRGDIDIVQANIEQLIGSDERARLEEKIRTGRIAIQNSKGDDLNALRWRNYLIETERRMREEKHGPIDIGVRKGVEHLFMATGWEPGEAQREYGGAAEIGSSISPVQTTELHYHSDVIYNTPDRDPVPRSDPNDLN